MQEKGKGQGLTMRDGGGRRPLFGVGKRERWKGSRFPYFSSFSQREVVELVLLLLFVWYHPGV